MVSDLRSALKRATGEVVHWAWETAVECAAIGPDSRRGRRFGRFGANSVICFPANAIFNEHYIHIGEQTMIGPEDLDLHPEVIRPVVPLAEAKEEFQRRYILEILERNNGNRTKAAQDLGVDPRTIFRYLEKEGEPERTA